MYEQIVLATSNTWTQTLDLDPKTPLPRKIYTLKNLDHERHEKRLGAERRLKDHIVQLY